MQDKKPKMAILNKGKDNKFINNEFHGFDIGIQDEGQRTLATGNKFQGVERYVEDVKDLPLWLKYALAIFAIIGTIGTLYGAWGTYITLNSQSSPQILENSPASNATSTIKIADIFSRYNEMDRAIDQQNFLRDYIGVSIYGTGSFNNIAGQSGIEGTYYLYLNTPGALVACEFNNSDNTTKRRLDLLRTGSKVSFFGTFTGSSLNGSSAWYIQECSFAN